MVPIHCWLLFKQPIQLTQNEYRKWKMISCHATVVCSYGFPYANTHSRSIAYRFVRLGGSEWWRNSLLCVIVSKMVATNWTIPSSRSCDIAGAGDDWAWWWYSQTTWPYAICIVSHMVSSSTLHKKRDSVCCLPANTTSCPNRWINFPCTNCFHVWCDDIKCACSIMTARCSYMSRCRLKIILDLLIMLMMTVLLLQLTIVSESSHIQCSM